MLRRSFTASARVTSSPPSRMRPEVGSTSRLIMRIVVVLPHPDGPTSTAIAPAGTSNESSSTAMVPSSYRLETRSSRIIGSPVASTREPLVVGRLVPQPRARDPGREPTACHPDSRRQQLARIDRPLDDVADRSERAGPALVVGAGRVVREVEVDDQPLRSRVIVPDRAEVGALHGVEHVAAAA